MKLRNKHTGEIVELESFSMHYKRYYKNDNGTSGWQPCSTYNKTLEEINAEWEDYEESKSYWYIDFDGEVLADDLDEFATKKVMGIGNYFETKEESEKAVEKLKAWKRLKDKGFRFKTFYAEDREIVIFGGSDIASSIEMWHDLDLLFSGEDD